MLSFLKKPSPPQSKTQPVKHFHEFDTENGVIVTQMTNFVVENSQNLRSLSIIGAVCKCGAHLVFTPIGFNIELKLLKVQDVFESAGQSNS